MSICELARAKVNLSLKVLGRRSDGYHELASLVTFAACGDRVRLSPGTPCRVTVTGPFAGDIVGENLLQRTLVLLHAAAPELRLGAVALEKELPVAAGLGGGSADAAALLRCVRRANPERERCIPWRHLALRLGADVPMCLDGVPAFVSGIGERSLPVAGLPQMYAVLANPRLPLPTSRVFAALAAPPAGPHGRAPAPPPTPSDIESVAAFMRTHGNALEPPAMALLPAVSELKAALAALPGCRIAAMSGSGATCFGLFASAAAARAGAALLAARQPRYWVVAAALAGSRDEASLNSPD